MISALTVASLLIIFSSVALGQPSASNPLIRSVLIRALVPEGTGTVYLSGNLPELGPWNPGKLAMTGSGRERIAELKLPVRATLEFKFTRGSWETVERGASGGDIANRTFVVPATGEATYTGTVANWRAASATKKSTATRSVSILSTNFAMPQLGATRRIWIYLPPDYATTSNAYPVLYMQDGQNVFDAATSFSGEWGVDETLDQLHAQGDRGCIVVAIDNSQNRMGEYNPWATFEQGGGRAKLYVDFLIHTLKPYIDQHYRTFPDRLHTGIAGSSAGAIISLYATLTRPEVFGRAGLFSCATWIAPEGISNCIRDAKLPADARFYFVTGESEGPAGIYAKHQRELIAMLATSGFPANTQVRSLIPADGQHAEWFWRREFPGAYQWLFADDHTLDAKKNR